MAKLVVTKGQIDTQHPYIKEFIEKKFNALFNDGTNWSYSAQVYVGLHFVNKFEYPISCSYIKGIPNSSDLYINPGNQRLLYSFMHNKAIDCLMITDEFVQPEWLINKEKYLDDIIIRSHHEGYVPIDPAWQKSNNSYRQWKTFVENVFQQRVGQKYGAVKIHYKDKLVVNIPNKSKNNKLTIINTESCFGVLESLDYMVGKQEKVFQEFSIRNYLTS